MKNLYLALLCFCLQKTVFSQEIDSSLARYNDGFAPEKLYLHFDKASYLPGETIWFKAYLMEEMFPAEKSKTVYVDWLGDDGTVLNHTVSPLVAGTTFGQFEIPAGVNSQMVHVRAYTRWMLNFDTAFVYKKDIVLINKNGQNLKTKPATIASLSFFAEGGDMIAGVNNRVAFKANDQWGLPVTVRGTIVDGKGKVIDSIRIKHDGMGTFQIIPEAGMTYTARWKDEKGGSHTTDLPTVREKGIAMQVAIEGTRRIVMLYSNSQIADNLKQLHLVGTINGQLAFKNDISINVSSSARRSIPTESLPSGILTLTLFDVAWNAIAERITFVDNHDYAFETSMDVLRWGLSKRKRNEIEVKVPDSLGDVSLSVSVTDVAVERDTAENIISHFLLTSDIKGYVHNPAFYFSDSDEKKKELLDLVMLTNGWRRFKWDEMIKGQMPKIAYKRDESYLSLSGQLMGVSKGQLSGTESLALIIKQKDSTANKLLIVPINTDGSFNDPGYVFFDTLNVYYSLKSKFLKQAEARFMANRLPPPNYTSFAKSLRSYKPADTTGMAYHYSMGSAEIGLKELQRNKVMETVYVKAKGKTPAQLLEEKYPSGLFKGTDGYQFDLVNDPTALGFTDIFMYLQGRVPGLQVTTGAETALSWRGGSPSLYLDEMKSDVDMISSVPVSDIAYIKVFRPPFMGSSGGGGNGAIAIYTKRGDDTRTSSGGLSSNKVIGYSQIREFYSPNYDRFDARNQDADVRTTLYWNPNVVIPAGKSAAKLSFYNNDVTKAFRVVIEGISKNGTMTHFEQIME